MKPYIRTGLIWSALMIAIMVGAVVWMVDALPKDGPVPVHFDMEGTPNRYASRFEAILIFSSLPAISAIVTVILAIAPSLDPRGTNIDAGRKAYVAVWVGVMIVLALATVGSCMILVNAVNGTPAGPGIVRGIIAACALLFVAMGNYLPKTRPSFILGVRTPWTLSSDIAWEKTHRLAGRLFIGAGLLGFLGAFVLDGIWPVVPLVALSMTAALVSVIYSYFAWRSADDRDNGTGRTG
ncbi:SdpI family protein [Hyphomonas johnsonii]|uniref:DUF1648 domain-containing protein n=1 Tax=Hyphomonas johnsonii MHS-2 TaxID=1280950 RepID=A0A059FP07_9PROT|nr:SdpI family protein [Hyphomonas johnsonii]KCZ92352.1 hypothetical protein HJO_09964 [Hyphomonas johnsonii MHS-2]